MALTHNIEHIKGDTKKLKVTLKDPADAPIDLTGAIVRFTIREDRDEPDDTTALITKVSPASLDVIDAVNGIFVITVDPLDTVDVETQRYYYDIQVTFPSGDVRTPVQGNWVIKIDTTKDY